VLNSDVRDYCIDVLKRKGMVLPMSVKEKYDKAFEKLTLSPEQISHRAEAAARQAPHPIKLFEIEVGSSNDAPSPGGAKA